VASVEACGYTLYNIYISEREVEDGKERTMLQSFFESSETNSTFENQRTDENAAYQIGFFFVKTTRHKGSEGRRDRDVLYSDGDDDEENSHCDHGRNAKGDQKHGDRARFLIYCDSSDSKKPWEV
jgi:hypothetical protein